ncbi:MAG TPA: (deoxy)nucleoside triphosphate pyrophosphohydrolase [Prolixibacteraceae bacterium]|nr:(deoxy)nucleoside triphosphate pyrophosphohydrolase [Prolixibacteraceae bacterium]
MLKVACALIVRQNKILLTQLDGDSAHAFQWEFPGGKLKPGESAEICIKREIAEELELEVIIVKQMKPVEYDYGFLKVKLIPFLCKIQSGALKLNAHKAFKWVPWNALQKNDLPGADLKLLTVPENRESLEKYFGEQMDNS